MRTVAPGFEHARRSTKSDSRIPMSGDFSLEQNRYLEKKCGRYQRDVY
jgi:hypothetical protein